MIAREYKVTLKLTVQSNRLPSGSFRHKRLINNGCKLFRETAKLLPTAREQMRDYSPEMRDLAKTGETHIAVCGVIRMAQSSFFWPVFQWFFLYGTMNMHPANYCLPLPCAVHRLKSPTRVLYFLCFSSCISRSAVNRILKT